MKQTVSKVPQIRFKGFKGEWNTRRLEEVATVERGKFSARPRNDPKYFGGNIPFVQTGDVVSANRRLRRYSQTLNEEGLAVSRSFPKDTILITIAANIGDLAIADFSVACPDSVVAINARDGFDTDFLHDFLGTKKGDLEAAATTAAQANINLKVLKPLVVVVPTVQEQTKIGEYFREMDSLIGLHQCKHDKLVTLKKAMLQKMFPQPGATTPEVRFNGFSGEWAKKKLGDSTANISNNTLSKADLNYHSGLAKNIHYGDILVKYGEVLDVHNKDVPFISDDTFASKLKHSGLQDGDVVMADAAEDEMVGKCTEIQNVRDQLVLAGLHTIALRPLDSFAPFYLGYYLNSDAFHNQLLRLMQGTKVLSVSKTVIKETVVYFPPDSVEQQKVGTYFRTLDELISKHAIQLQKLNQIKSSCLGKMFV